MSTALTERVLQILQEEGIDAVAAYPGRKMPVLTAPCAAVQLQHAELARHEAQVQITVVSPAKLGGSICESTAAAAAAALQNAGADCVVNGCSFEGNTGCFCANVSAGFHGYHPGETWDEPMTVTIGGVRRKSAVSVVFWRATDEDITVLRNAQWHFRLEELFIPGAVEEAEPAGSFSLAVQQGSRREELVDCSYTSQRRENGPGGTRQIREGVAQAYTVTA